MLTKASINFTIILFFCHFTNWQLITIMPTKPKTVKKKHSNKIILVIFILYSIKKLHKKIANYIKILKLIITKIL